MHVHAYLTFSGNCRQAMAFYQRCLGGNLTVQTVGESPLSATMSARMKNCVVQAILQSEAFVLIGSDMVPESGLIKGNSVSLALQCHSEKRTRAVFKKLSARGHVSSPLHHTRMGFLLGAVTDQFGHHWLLTDGKKLVKTPDELKFVV